VNYVAHADAAERLADETMAAGGRAIAVMADVVEATTVEMMVARAEKELAPVTILVSTWCRQRGNCTRAYSFCANAAVPRAGLKAA
jgi:NADP-dependent 3-hydroxy acid dehydrogenase YdfG